MKAMILKYGLFLGFLVLLSACLENRDIVDIGAHPSGWMQQSSNQFHGLAVKSSEFESENCKTCHGENYSGGTSQVSCYDSQCHISFPHPQDFALSHATFVSEEIRWDITTCRGCHGADYAGAGSEDKNCLKCHSGPDGPETCNLCHGNSNNSAPPEDLAGNELTTSISVGAHQAHFDSTWSSAHNKDCKMCHIEPLVFDMNGHVDGKSPQAEVIFDLFVSDSGNVMPVWDRGTATCSNIYCHGAFTFKADSGDINAWVYSDSGIVGNNNTVVWNSVGTGQADCNTCHDMPPKGHFDRITACEQCHASVVGPGNVIINKELHINGKVDL